VSATCSQGRPYIYKLELKTDHIYDDENRPYIITENRPYIMTENRPILYDQKTLYNGNKPCIVESDYNSNEKRPYITKTDLIYCKQAL
jgi:hypothetical protein